MTLRCTTQRARTSMIAAALSLVACGGGSGSGNSSSESDSPNGNSSALFPHVDQVINTDNTDTGDTQAVKLADLNNDGHEDAIFANYVTRSHDGGNVVYLNDKSGTLVQTESAPGDTFTESLALGDVNDDGNVDAVFANNSDNKVFLGDGSGMFDDSGLRLRDQGLDSGITDVALTNADRNDSLDVLFTYSDIGHLLWLGASSPYGSGEPYGQNQTSAVETSRIPTADRDLMIFAKIGPNTVWIGTDNQGHALGDRHSADVALGDVNSDGFIDAVFANTAPFGANPPGNTIWLGDGSGGFVDSGVRLGDSDSNAVSIADLNNDGTSDLVFANASTNNVWIGQGSTSYKMNALMSSSNRSYDVGVGDFNRDGASDLLFVNNRAGDTIWLNAREP